MSQNKNIHVCQVLHGIVGAQKALGRHDDADVALANGSGTVFTGLKGDEVEADHVACEVDLTNTVGENFFLFHRNCGKIGETPPEE